MPELEASYVLPLRRDHDSAGPELAAYLRRLAGLAEVLVVDGSPEPVWRAHHQAFGDRVTHLRPDPGLAFANGKVNGVLTGLAAAGHEAVVLADDDVRYDQEGLRRLVGLLKAADLVRPQNYFAPLPWHASLDTARTLLNRVAGGDFPGTLAVRRSLVLDAGGYDGDVLFENLELLRTVRAAGGTVLTPLDLYVRRLPPGAGHFLGQRVRQAYDELARPARLAAALAVLPRGGRPGRPAALVAAGRSGRPGRSRRRDRPPPGRRAGRVPGLQQPAGAGVAAGARGQLVAGRARPPVPGRRHLRRRPAAPGGHPRAGPAGPPGRQGQCPGRP